MDNVKAPEVKPCIVYITLLPCSVGSKVPSASGLHCGLAPLVIVTIVG